MAARNSASISGAACVVQLSYGHPDKGGTRASAKAGRAEAHGAARLTPCETNSNATDGPFAEGESSCVQPIRCLRSLERGTP